MANNDQANAAIPSPFPGPVLILPSRKWTADVLGETWTRPCGLSFPVLVPAESRLITACPHKDKKHYAEHMCSTCYHRFCQKAKTCGHADKPLYARGMCQRCYLRQHNVTSGPTRRRRTRKPSI